MVTVELAVTVVTSVETAVTVTVLPEGTEAGAVYVPLLSMVPTEEFPPVVPFTCQVTVFKLPPEATALKVVLVPTFKDMLVGEITTVTVLVGAGAAAWWHAAKHSATKIKIAKVSGERARRRAFMRLSGPMGRSFWVRVLGSIATLCQPCSPA